MSADDVAADQDVVQAAEVPLPGHPEVGEGVG